MALRDAEGYELTPAIRLIRTPATLSRTSPPWLGARRGWSPYPSVERRQLGLGDRHAVDLAGLHAGRRRVLAVADTIVPGHGTAFAPNPSTPR